MATVATMLLFGTPALAHEGDSSDDDDKYILVWAGDADDQQSDFLAVIDGDPKSKDYGKVVKTYTLPAGFDKVNEPHHMNHHVSPNCKLFAGGLLSGNVFVFDVRDPLNVPAPRVLSAGVDFPFTVPDDFQILPNGNVIGTFVGSMSLVSPGGVVEFDPEGNVVSWFAVGNDASSNPHGISLKPDINRLVTSDFGVPITLFSSNNFYEIATHSSVRIFDLATRELLHIVSLPTGARYAASNGDPHQRETFAVMEVAFLNGHGKTGFFASAMGGGGLFYCPDATSATPACHLVYDYGYNSGPGALSVTHDDRYLIQPLSTVGQGGTPKKVVVFDIADPMHPQVVQEVIVPDPTTGGPHFGTFNESQTRYGWTDYFVDDARIPVKVDGDHRLYVARWKNGRLHVDRRFRDENDGGVGVNFNRISWPHGEAGFASPHGLVFMPRHCVPGMGGGH
jgi:hypothetical protein